jgi:hypothetical protein
MGEAAANAVRYRYDMISKLGRLARREPAGFRQHGVEEADLRSRPGLGATSTS